LTSRSRDVADTARREIVEEHHDLIRIAGPLGLGAAVQPRVEPAIPRRCDGSAGPTGPRTRRRACLAAAQGPVSPQPGQRGGAELGWADAVGAAVGEAGVEGVAVDDPDDESDLVDEDCW
jgi:hypothetical protein